MKPVYLIDPSPDGGFFNHHHACFSARPSSFPQAQSRFCCLCCGVGATGGESRLWGAGFALPQHRPGGGDRAAAKGIDAAWLASLRVRETSEPTFTKAADQLRYIGMPVGGIACGTLYLGGEGIRPRSRYYAHPSGGGNSYNRSCTDGTNYFAPIDVWNPTPPVDEKPFPFDQGFVLRTVVGGTTVVKTLDYKGFSDISFRGSYPLAKVNYADASCPLTVELCATRFLSH